MTSALSRPGPDPVPADTEAAIEALTRASARLLAASRRPAAGVVKRVGQLTWPARVRTRAIHRLLRTGRRACVADGGPAPWMQALAMWRLAARHPLPAAAYYRYRLYRPEFGAIAGRFLEFNMLSVVEGAILDARNADRRSLTDKRAFANVCAAHGVATAPVLAWCAGGSVEEAHAFPDADLFSKPGALANGRGASLWLWQGNGRWSDGTLDLDRAGLLAELARRSLDGAQMLQPRVINHHDIVPLASGGVCTARVVTLRFPGMRAEHLQSVFKMTAHGGAADNFLRGGLLAPIDPATGELGAALIKKAGHVRQGAHPDSGANIPGTRLPYWHETLDLCLRFHDRAFDRMPGIGWDVAITDDGPLLIEGNWNWSPSLMQVGHAAPLGETRLPACYLAHVADLGL